MLLTNDLYRVLDKGETSGIKSMSGALLKVISQEFPTIHTKHVDISLLEDISDPFLDHLFMTLQGEGRGKVICLRHARTWEQIFEPIRTKSDGGKSRGIRRGGVYLITGGLGNLGFCLTEFLLVEERAKVILLGQPGLPARDKWPVASVDSMLTAESKKKIERLRTLEGKGEVIYLDPDITDIADLRRAVEAGEARFGPVNGVVHAAGVIRGHSINPVKGLTRQDFRHQFDPKINGLIALRDIFGGKDLDFCLLASSISAVLGGVGFGAYASANAFMDHFVQSYREQGELNNWVSLNLDGLDFDNMATRSINKKEITQVFRTALTLTAFPQVVVSATDLQTRLQQWVLRTAEQEDDQQGDEMHIGDREGSMEDMSLGTGSQDEVERKLLELWRNYFGKPEITMDDDFFSIGGDSLKALTMIGRIHKMLNIDISIQEFFNRPTLRKLSEYIQSPGALEKPDLHADLLKETIKSHSDGDIIIEII
jgi:NAD(P)-dependent dehydrogenase (short-subunit alcohol dehydrogenase family)/acyl carrier protein